MGKLDTVTKAYMKNNSVFADAFNYLLYGGRQVLDPSRLQELDTVELSIPFGNGEEAAVQRFRDLLKMAAFMTDDEAAYLVLGVENEADIKYAEPVKAGLYDFLQYARQVQQTAARHREQKDRKGHDAGEFLSGFYREDRLIPVITLVILFGSKRWDGPRTLHEMMTIQDPDILKHVADYKLNLIEPAAMEEKDLDKLHSSLRLVLGFIKYADDGKELAAFFSKESGLRELDVEAARVIRACTNTDIQFDEKAEVIDVCKAVQEMNEKARQEGRQEGRLEGHQEGRQEALSEVIRNVMESLHLTFEEAMKVMKVAEKDQAVLKKMI